MQNCCFSSVMCGKPRTDDCLSMASAVRFTRASIRVYLKANCGSIPNSGGGFVSVSGLPRPFCAVWPCGRVAVWPCGRVAVWPCGRVAVWPCGWRDMYGLTSAIKGTLFGRAHGQGCLR